MAAHCSPTSSTGRRVASSAHLAPISFEAILPVARSCVLAGAVDTAMTWLQSVRKDWMRSEYLNSLKTDSVFAPLWSRPAFPIALSPVASWPPIAWICCKARSTLLVLKTLTWGPMHGYAVSSMISQRRRRRHHGR
jgi:hypothetical protein